MTRQTPDSGSEPGRGSGTGTSAPARPPSSSEGTSTGRGALLTVILAGQFMATLDVSIVNVAAPSIRTGLHTSDAALQIIITGYTIAYAVLLITSSRLGQHHGYSRFFTIGLSLFTLASLACGLAPDSGTLIGFRVLQGAGAALMVPQVMSLIQNSFSGPSRVQALGIYTAVLAGGAVVGQIVGGVLVSADLFGIGWRAVFLVNVPIGVALLAVGRRLLPVVEGNRERRLDVPGTVIFAATIGLFVVPLVLGHELGWPEWIWLMLALSAVLALLFAGVERRVTARGGSPMIKGRVLTSPGLAPAASAILLTVAGFSGFLLVFALHMQSALDYTPQHAGLLFLPLVVGFGCGGLYWRRLPGRFHRFLPTGGLLLSAGGYLALALLQRHGEQVGPAAEAALGVVGLTTGAAYGPLFAQALSRVATTDAADASGVMNVVIQLGQVVGISLPGTLYLSRVSLPASAGQSAHALSLTTVVIAAVPAVAAGALNTTKLRTRKLRTSRRPR